MNEKFKKNSDNITTQKFYVNYWTEKKTKMMKVLKSAAIEKDKIHHFENARAKERAMIKYNSILPQNPVCVPLGNVIVTVSKLLNMSLKVSLCVICHQFTQLILYPCTTLNFHQVLLINYADRQINKPKQPRQKQDLLNKATEYTTYIQHKVTPQGDTVNYKITARCHC